MNINDYKTILQAEEYRNMGTFKGAPIIPAWQTHEDGCVTAFCRCGDLHYHSPVVGVYSHRWAHCNSYVNDTFRKKGYYLILLPVTIPPEVVKASRVWGKAWREFEDKNPGQKVTGDHLFYLLEAKFNKSEVNQ